VTSTTSSDIGWRAEAVVGETGAVPELVLPTPSVRESFLAAMEEFVAAGVELSQTAAWIDHHAPGWAEPEAFAAFVAALDADALEETPRPEWHVPCTTLWWVDGPVYLGRLAIRHRLNDFLLEVGGHIGYDVRPTRRREGHATGMLRASLPWARDLGIDPALVTCDTDNVASSRVIEAAGGVLEDVRGVKRRYWVPTS
jgi:predicted acetyltransferase